MATHLNYCAQAEEEDFPVRYLAGTLSSAESDTYELHYFDCSRCFALLEAARLAKKTLAPAIPVRRFSPWLAMAAAVVFGATGLWILNHRPEPARSVDSAVVSAPKPELTSLARFEPPHYEEQAMRGASNPRDKRFREAMRNYSSRNYEAAASELDRFLKTDPDYLPARFYAASAKLLANQPDPAMSDFQLVLASKNSDFTEEAQWGMANAALLKNNAPLAQTYLAPVAQGHGLFSARAKQLLTKLAPTLPQPPAPR